MDQPHRNDELSSSSYSGQAEAIIDRPDVQNLILVVSLCVLLFGIAELMISPAVDVCAERPRNSTGFCVDVNRASAEELSLLPQVGPVLADRIVAERVAHGPFLSVADIARTAGIGPDRIVQLTPLVTAGR